MLHSRYIWNPGLAPERNSSPAARITWRRGLQHWCLLGLILALTAPGWAQNDSGGHLTNVTIELVNGTTREPGRADTVVLTALKSTSGPLESTFDAEGRVIFHDVELSPYREYLVEVTRKDVPYFAKASGRELEQGPLTVYIFDTTTEITGLRVAGMNCIVRRTEAELQLEYLWTVTNDSTPQQSVVPNPYSLALTLPTGVHSIQAEILSRPTATPLATVSGPEPGWHGLVVPLPPGQTRLRLTASMPYAGHGNLPIAANLPLHVWSVLTSPPDLELTAEGLTTGELENSTGLGRFHGPQLAANQILDINISGGAAPAIAARTASATDSIVAVASAETVLEQSRSKSAMWVLVLAALIILYLMVRLRRRS
ncbi:MAG: hypothetical protein ABIF77_19705 [bacterium]